MRLPAPVRVLDHGRIQLVDVMGSDRDIDAAARVSFAGTEEEDRLPSETRRLIRYLMRNRHTSPFEMAELKFQVKAPIFVARQWVRHRTSSWNEISARYTVLPDDVYIPSPDRLALQSQDNKQGSGEVFGDRMADQLLSAFTANAEDSVRNYHKLVATGLARETARGVTTVFHYTEWVWKVNLHNLLHFLCLRLHPHAQWEIREFASVIAGWVEAEFPMVWEAFQDYRLDAHTFSRQEMLAIRAMAAEAEGNGGLDRFLVPAPGLSSREVDEFLRALRQV